MSKTIKLSVIHSRDAWLWEEADPYNKAFDPEAPRRFVESNIEKTLLSIEEAGRLGADLVCTHEDFKGSGGYIRHMDHPWMFTNLVEEIPGPTTDRLGEISKKYGMYIAANYFEKCGDEIYNTTVLIGRGGEITGKYRKVHLPPSEKWRVTGGREFTVIGTDIGNIGFATCYDIYFPEHCRAMALNGADLIIHQTQGWGIASSSTGEAVLRTRAVENSVYLAVVKNIQPGDGGKSCIISNYGDILAQSDSDAEGIVTVEFKPEFDMRHDDHFNSFFSGVSSIKARQALEREPSLYAVLTDVVPPLLGQFKGEELHTTPEKARKVFEKWREYTDAVKNNRPVDVKYHW